MLVHFIGGPAHGRLEVISNPHAIYRQVTIKPQAHFARIDFPVADVPFEEHEYKITKRTPRYAIAEWQAPPVDVRFEVHLEIDPFDRQDADRLRQFVRERRTEEKHGVRCIGATDFNVMKFDLSLQVRVEGPKDAVAVQLAAEKVQHFLDAELPPCIQHIRSVDAST